jgi:hypothetical protein
MNLVALAEIEQIDAVLAEDGKSVVLYGWTRDDSVWLASVEVPGDAVPPDETMLRQLEQYCWDTRAEVPWRFPSQCTGSLLADAMQTRH